MRRLELIWPLETSILKAFFGGIFAVGGGIESRHDMLIGAPQKRLYRANRNQGLFVAP